MKTLKIALAALAISSFASHADNHDVAVNPLLTNDNFSVGYTTTDVDGLELDGFVVQTGSQWNNGVYTSLQYTKTTGDVMGWDVDAYTLKGIVGKQFAIDSVSLWEVEAGALVAAVDTALVDESETFFTAGASYKRMLTESISMNAGVDYVDGETSFVVGGEYNFNNTWAVNASYLKNSDEDTMMLQAVYRF